MKSNKIIQLLSKLNNDELKEFEKFTDSPYFSRERNLSHLFKELKVFYPDFNNENLNPEYLFGKLYPGKKFNGKASLSLINTLTSELYKTGKRFLIQLEFEKNNAYKKYFLLESLRKKNLNDEFIKESDKLPEDDTFVTRSVNYIKNYILYNPQIEYMIGKSDFESAFGLVSEQSDDLIIATFFNSVNYAEQKYVAENIFNVKTKPGFADHFFESVDLKNFTDKIKEKNEKYLPFIDLHYLQYMFFKFPDIEKYFFEYKSLVYSNIEKFNQS